MPGKQREQSSPAIKEKPRPKVPDLTAILDTESDAMPKVGGGDGGDAGGGSPEVAPVPSQVSSKMWKVKEFQKKTDEGLLTKAGTAQKQIAEMITTYLTKYSSGGAVSNKDVGKAVDLLLQMRQSVNWWISDHEVDVDNGLGGVATVTDPRRKKRMAGMREFRTFVDAEITSLQSHQSAIGDGASVSNDITEKHPGFLKLETRYDGSVKSMFTKVGTIIDKAVPRDGDSITLELEFQVPCDPSGVGYVGGRLKALASRDDGFVKVRAELAVTGGATVDFAKIGGEIGGYLEAQADTASGAMTLMSYGMYRRFKESHAMPEEVSSFLWAGSTGAFGKGKSEQWSLAVEKQEFGSDDDQRKEKTYVESGGLAGVKASMEAGILTGGVSLGATAGRRTDFTSLQNRKGGAGKANRPSDSVIAQGARAVSGGTRGAQKRVGRDVYGTLLTSSIDVGLGGVGKIGWDVKGELGWESDGVSKTLSGKEPTTKLTKNELTLVTRVNLGLGALMGPAGSAMLEALAERVIIAVRERLKAVKEDDAAGGAVALHSTEAGMSLLKNSLTASGVSAVTAGSDAQVSLAVTWDGMTDALTFEIRKGNETGIEVPKALSVKMSRSSRMIKITYKGGAWSLS